MRIRSLYLYFITVIISGFLGVLPTYAACVVPAGTVGDQVYNTSFNVMQYCDGTDWTAMRGDGGAKVIDDLSDATGDYVLNNIFLGQGAGNPGVMTDSSTIALGVDALASVTTGSSSGYGALAIGHKALEKYTSSQWGPTAIGHAALQNLTTGKSNTAVGRGAGSNGLSTGVNNTFMGDAAGAFVGGNVSYTTAIGASAFYNPGNSGFGFYNTAIGASSMKGVGGSANSTAVGVLSLGYAKGSNNVALGMNAGHGDSGGTSTAANSVFVGYSAGQLITTGNNNIFMGYQAGDATTTGGDNIVIGANIDTSAAGASNELNIGNILFGSGVGTTLGSKIGAVEYCDETLTTCTLAANLGGTAGGLWTDNTTHITYENMHILKAGETMATAGLEGGEDNKMVWYPDKGAFRVGDVEGGGAWDEANIGTNSMRWGGVYFGFLGTHIGNTASGYASTAWGQGTIASGPGATAWGGLAYASGQYATAWGSSGTLNDGAPIASAYSSTAFGFSSRASGDYSVAWGGDSSNQPVASGFESLAFGKNAKASGDYSMAFGWDAIAGSGTAGDGAGDGTIVFGLGDSIAGQEPTATGTGAVGIFMGAQNNVDFSASNTMGIFGGPVMIDPATPATELAVSGALALDVEGQIGATGYCDKDGLNCFVSTDVGGAADNLGNHTATQAVDMASFDINNGGVVNMQKAFFTPIAASAPTK